MKRQKNLFEFTNDEDSGLLATKSRKLSDHSHWTMPAMRLLKDLNLRLTEIL